MNVTIEEPALVKPCSDSLESLTRASHPFPKSFAVNKTTRILFVRACRRLSRSQVQLFRVVPTFDPTSSTLES